MARLLKAAILAAFLAVPFFRWPETPANRHLVQGEPCLLCVAIDWPRLKIGDRVAVVADDEGSVSLDRLVAVTLESGEVDQIPRADLQPQR